MKKLILLSLFTAMLLPAWTQNEEKRAKKKAALMTFLEEQLPEAKTELDAILKDEGEAAHKAALREFRMLFREYKDAKEFMGDEAAEMMVSQTRLMLKADKAAAAYEDAAEADKPALRKKLGEAVLALNKEGIKAMEMELEMIKQEYNEEIEMIEEEIEVMKELAADPDAAIEEYLEMAELDVGEQGFQAGGIGAPAAKAAKLPEGWHTEPEKALAAAKESGKPVMMVFSTSWCGPCVAMVKGVYPKDDVKKALESFEAVYVDGDKYGQVCKTYKVRGFPTFVIADAEGEAKTSKVGGMNAAGFIAWLEKNN